MRGFVVFCALASAGCRTSAEPNQDGAGTGDGTAASSDSPSEWVYEGAQSGSATYDRATVEGALAALVQQAPRMSADPVLDAYNTALESSDEGCPAWYELDGNTFWYASCTASSGMSFDGYGFTYLYQQEDIFGDGALWDAELISGVATIRNDAQQTLHIGGQAYRGTGYNAQYNGDLWVSQVVGGFYWDWAQAEGTWLGDGIESNLTLYAIDYPDWEARYFYIAGSATGLGEGASAVETTALVVIDEGMAAVQGLNCAAEPIGAVAVRDAGGAWWEVAFDRADFVNLPESLCDGCGTVWYQGEAVGEACMDAASLNQWEGTPW